MAKKSEKKRREEMRSRDELNGLKWRAAGGSKEEGEKLGLLTALFPEKVTEIEQKQAALEIRAKEHMKDLKESQDEVVRLWKTDEKSAKSLGKALLEVQDKMKDMKRGSFKAWWVSEGFDKNRVSYCMRLAAPTGDKVKAAKDERRRSPRVVAFSAITDKLEKLWELKEEDGSKREAETLLDDIIEEIRKRFFAKPKTMAASA